MKTEEYRYLKTFAECQNIREAAKLCNIDRSTMSRCISRFEKEIKTQLFVNTAYGIKQTEHGKEALKIVGDILNIYDQLMIEISQINNVPTELRLAIDEAFDMSLIKPLISKLKDKIPTITFSLYQKPLPELLMALNRQELDAIFTANLKNKPEYSFLPVLEDHLVLAAFQNLVDDTVFISNEIIENITNIKISTSLKITDNSKIAWALGYFYQAQVISYQSQIDANQKEWTISYLDEVPSRMLGWIIKDDQTPSLVNLLTEVSQ